MNGTLMRADRDDKRELILDEASAQFNERGFYDVRLEDIAEALGATKASISYHFQSKRALLEAAYDRTCDHLDMVLRTADKKSDGLAQASAWIGGVAKMQAGGLINTLPQLAILNDLNALDEAGRASIGSRIANQFETIEGYLGDIGLGKRARAAALLLWTMPGWITQWLSAIPPRRHERQIGCLVYLFQSGIASEHNLLDTMAFPHLGASSDLLFNREERARLKRDAFERAGIRSFNQRGYAGFSLNALADELGVSRGTFYYTFADKDELLEACAHRSHQRILQVLEAIDAAKGPVLPTIVAGFTKLYSEHSSNLEPMLRGCIYSSLSDPKGAVAAADWQSIAAQLARLLAQCTEQGGCQTHGVEKLELLLLAALRNIAVSPGLADVPKGNPFGATNGTDYFSPFFVGISRNS